MLAGDTIGSSIFNRLVSVIISIEPTKGDDKVLLVKALESWFSKFMPFTYKLTEDTEEHMTMHVDLAPSVVEEVSRTKEIPLQSIGKGITIRQLRRLLAEFVNTKKLKKRGQQKSTEYCVIGLQP